MADVAYALPEARDVPVVEDGPPVEESGLREANNEENQEGRADEAREERGADEAGEEGKYGEEYREDLGELSRVGENRGELSRVWES